MADVLLAPLLSLFSGSFYARIRQASLAHGLTYLAYLALLIAVTAVAMLRQVWLPMTDELIPWLAEHLPAVTLTRDGAVSEAPQPLTLTHPTLGTLLIDTTKDIASEEDKRAARIIVTRTQLVVRDSEGGEERAFELLPTDAAAKAKWEDVTVDGARVKEYYDRYRGVVEPVMFTVCFVGVYVYKLVAALVYALLAQALSRLRAPGLSYAAALNVACFALTPVVLLQCVRGWVSLPLSLVVTGAYLWLGVSSQPNAALSEPVA
jgi:hypothetical protein